MEQQIPTDAPIEPARLRQQIAATAFAFRGYNVTNLGRSREMLAHPAYGPIYDRFLREASEISAEVLSRPIDLASRVREGRETTLESFDEDIGLILAVELAQLAILREQFNIEYAKGRLAFGYSLGEITALIAGGVFDLADSLPPLIALADDCVELARDATMGIVFSRGPALNYAAVERLCLDVNADGRGVIGVSAILSPNTVLVLGQSDTVDRFKRRMPEALGPEAHLRKNEGSWPPLHTPLLWQRNVPNRAAVMLHAGKHGFATPHPPVVSLVTGKTSYNDYNSRDLLNRWIDHPQRLWDAVCETLASGTNVVVHVGPAPNVIPATFKRLSDNVTGLMSRWSINGFGLRAVSGVVNRPWLAKMLSSRAVLLRAPFVRHVILEDWLLAQGDDAPS